jgi:hypothetical protein
MCWSRVRSHGEHRIEIDAGSDIGRGKESALLAMGCIVADNGTSVPYEGRGGGKDCLVQVA